MFNLKNRYLLVNTLLILSCVFLAPLVTLAKPFSIARVHYNGGGDWYSDPSSLVNLLAFYHQEIGTLTSDKEINIKITDSDFSRYPYLYLTGHGNISLSDTEVEKLRMHLLAGGFLHVDDNYGLDKSFRRELKKVFPYKKLVEIPFSHPIYSILFPFPNGLPKIHEHDGLPAQGYGIIHEGRLVLFYTYQCDLGDGWEDLEVHQLPEEKHLSALKMGANILAYALSGMEKMP